MADIGCYPAVTWYEEWDFTTWLPPAKPVTWLFAAVGSGGPSVAHRGNQPGEQLDQ